MSATIGAVHQVVNLQRARRAAAGHAAAAAVATPDEAHHTGRNVLICALGAIAVERADALRVAAGALDRCDVDGDRGSAALLPTLPAALAHRDGDLELCAPGRLIGRCAVEHRVAE